MGLVMDVFTGRANGRALFTALVVFMFIPSCR